MSGTQVWANSVRLKKGSRNCNNPYQANPFATNAMRGGKNRFKHKQVGRKTDFGFIPEHRSQSVCQVVDQPLSRATILGTGSESMNYLHELSREPPEFTKGLSCAGVCRITKLDDQFNFEQHKLNHYHQIS